MVMPTSKPDRASAVQSLTGPHDDLWLPDFGPHVRVATANAVGFDGIGRGCRDQDARKSTYVFAEADVVIPLIANMEWFHAAGDRMIRQRIEIRIENRVYRVVQLEQSANPVEHFLMAAMRRRFGGVVIEHQPGAARRRLADNLCPIVLEGKM